MQAPAFLVIHLQHGLGMILHQSIGAVNLPVAIKPPVRIRSPKLANKGAGKAEVNRPVARPRIRNLEAVDEMDVLIPALEDNALSLHPLPPAQSLVTGAGQVVQL